MLSRSCGLESGRVCGVSGRTKSTLAASGRLIAAAIPNAQVVPAVLMTTAASTGPTERPTLKVTEFSARAVEKYLASTRVGTSAIIEGDEKALRTPRARAKAINVQVVAPPSAAVTVRAAVITTAENSLIAST